MADGIRTDPPMSVPTPMMEPFIAMSAPSPPLLPPGLSFRLCGLWVRPKRWLFVSPWRLWTLRMATVESEGDGERRAEERTYDHESLRHIRPAVEDRAGVSKESDDGAVPRRDAAKVRDVAHRQLGSSDVKLVLE